MCLFVERAKKCLDFGVTLYFVDLLVQSFYSVRTPPASLSLMDISNRSLLIILRI